MENPPFEDVFPTGKVNFHCHVSLLEGIHGGYLGDHPLTHSIHVMYGIFTYVYHTNQPNVGKYTIHGSYGL